MTQSSDHPALRLFYHEQQELMEQVGEALTTLAKAPSLPEFQRLRRSIRLIHQGAVQMGIDPIAQHTKQFLDILHPDTTPIGEGLSSAQLEVLTELFKALQKLSFSTLPDAPSALVVSPQFLMDEFSDPDERSDENDRSMSAPTQSNSGLRVSQDIRQILLHSDITEAIAQLQHSQTHLSSNSLITDVHPQIEALLGWGEVLDWPELTTYAMTLKDSIKAHPKAIASILSVGILGLKALHQGAIWQTHQEANPNTNHGGTAPKIEPDQALKSYQFETQKKFLWQSQQAIFVVDSDAIAETLVPQVSDIIIQDNIRYLPWQGQTLPLLNLRQLLEHPRSPSASAAIQHTDPSPILIISRTTKTLALEVELDQFIRASNLTVTPIPASSQFLLGSTALQQGAELPLIDVLKLLDTVPSITSHASLSAAQPRSQVIPPPPFSHPTDPPIAPASSPLAQPHILVVDDSRTIRYLLQQLFDRANYRVTLAEDGLEAIEKLKGHPDIALMVSDVEMPRLTGFELLNRCRRDPKWQQLPIIILSQCPDQQNHDQLSKQFGANAYVPKPFEHDKFLGIVVRLLKDYAPID